MSNVMNSVIMNKGGKYGFGLMPIPKPGPNQVLIKVECCALNPSDIMFMKGWYKIKHDYPFTPGWEGSGTVIDCGPGMGSEWLRGRRVAFTKELEVIEYRTGGSYCEYQVTNIKACIPLPDDVDFEQGATYFINPLTALGLVRRAKKLGASTIILTAAASQLGRMVIRLCPKYGLTPICTVRRPEQADMLRNELGQKYVVDTSLKSWKKDLGKFAMALKP